MENIYLSLAKARVEVQKKCTKKSGYNKFAGFDYFELKDFLSVATDELSKVGLCAIFNIKRSYDEQGVMSEIAYLTITNGEKEIVFETPTAEANVKGANEIQILGSKHTYLKRYLYMNALELSESDGVDATIGKDKDGNKQENIDSIVKNTPPVKATQNQINLINKLFDEENIKKMISFYKVSKLEDLTVVQASQALSKKKNQIVEKTCPSCGAKNDSLYEYCTSCGAKLTE